MLSVTQLFELYNTLGKNCSADISAMYSKQTLKSKLITRFPGLNILKCRQGNKSDIVYFDETTLTKSGVDLSLCDDDDPEDTDVSFEVDNDCATDVIADFACRAACEECAT